MHISAPQAFPVSLLLSICEFGLAVASPSPITNALHVPLRRNIMQERTPDEWALWAKQQKEMLEIKYGGQDANLQRRSSGYNSLVNQNYDSSYFGSLAIGTPAVAYDVVLDTGSADLWLADSNCTSGCTSNTQTFDSSTSTSFTNLGESFSVQYGSGQASGTLGQDVVQMAGFEVNNQVFGVCDVTSSGLIDAPISGLLGLGWKTLASSGATPLWQALYESNVLDSPLMAFHLTRYLNASDKLSQEPGGTFTLGAVNSSLYTGDIDYQSLIDDGQSGYWALGLQGLTVNGASVTISSSEFAIIDTGTTLIGGPSDIVANIYAQIPGSAALTGSSDGYYSFPCDTDVTVTLAFGGPAWSISPADFNIRTLVPGSCVGAIFTLSNSISPTAVTWIIGDSFLKNVYSVFRANPSSVGFATLSTAANMLSGESADDVTIPTPTIGTVSASITGTRVNGAVGGQAAHGWGWIVVGAAALVCSL